MVVVLIDRTETGSALARLADALEQLEFGPVAARQSAERDRLAAMIRSYLIPRTRRPTPPTTVVVAGPTGSGKSTLLNSLLGRDVSRTGVLRPTTRRPVVVAPPGIMDDDRAIGGVDCEVVTADPAWLESVVLVDSPDIDSTSTEHRAAAETLIDNADVVVFVSSALRYADDVPWQVLRRAESRGIPVVHVLNRVGSPSAGAIVDFRSRLVSAGLDDDIVTVPEHHLPEGAHQIPGLSVRSLRERLDGVLSDRGELARRVFERVLRSTVERADDLAREIARVSAELDELSAGFSARLTDRVEALDFEGSGERLYPEPPPDPSMRAARRWKRRSRRIVAGRMADAEQRLVDHLVSFVHADLRRWLTEERSGLLSRGVDLNRLTPDIVALTRSSLEGWVEFVTRIAADYDERDVLVGEAILLEGALTAELPPAGRLLFGDDASVLTARARRELWGRLGVVYDQVGGLVIEAVRRRFGSLDEGELRAAVDAAGSALAPAHA